MQRYYKLVIIIFGIVILGGVLAWFFLLLPSGQDQPGRGAKSVEEIVAELAARQSSQTSTSTSTNQTPADWPVKLAPLSAEELQKKNLQNFIRAFIEQWGTWSNHSNFNNLRSLDNQLTKRMKNFREEYIKEILQAHPYQQGYFGVTTKVVTVDLGDISQGLVSLTAQVGTRRVEEAGDSERVFNQNVRVNLVKTDDSWLVDGVFWEE